MTTLKTLAAGTALAGAMLLAAAPAMAARYEKAPARAASFTVRTLDGKALKTSEFKGKPMIVDFWATWCGPCRFAMPHLDAIQKRYAKDGLVVIGLSVDEVEPARVKAFVERLGVGFRIAMASDEALREYGPIRALPTTFFIARDGKVVRRVIGYIDEETMDVYASELIEKR